MMCTWCCGLTTSLILLLLLSAVDGSYVFRVRAHRYWNSRHKLADGTCCELNRRSSCDPWWCAHCECDNRFKFCLRSHGASRDGNENSCALGSFSTGEIGDDSFSFGSSQIASGVSNPMIFGGDVWRGGFQLLVAVHDEDSVNSDDLVDDVYVVKNISPGQSISESEYLGREGNSHIILSFSLTCSFDFYGSNCATYCVARDDSNGHYICHSSTGVKICRSGWSDPSNNCLSPVCASNCNSRGGYCNSPGQCLCRTGWTGSGCHQCVPTSNCSAVGGYCNIPGECICREGYSGANCEIDLIPCQRGDLCSEGVLCTNDGLGSYRCHCPVGYTGPVCDVEIDECDPNPCSNGSTCIDLVGGFNCECSDGYEGTYCHIDIDECLSNPCLNDGQCLNIINGFICICTGGYDGDICERNHDDCTPYPCENGGTCNDLLGGYECQCAVGWTGDRCQLDIDDCVSIPCQHNGSCLDEVNGYQCLCVIGWEGENCENETNECSHIPCQNGAKCNDFFASYNCTCAAGYYGTNCEYELDECLPNPCHDRGVCHDEVNNYSCHCNTGYTGQDCEVDLLPCRGNPCHNGGTCLEEDNDYSCICPPQFTDYNCLSPLVSAEIQGVTSTDDENNNIMKYVYGVVPAVLVLLIMITAIALIVVYWRRKRNRIPILPPPNEPMGKEMSAAVKVDKEVDMLGTEYASISDDTFSSAISEPHVYESLDTYAVPSNVPVTTPPLKATAVDYCNPGISTNNPYSNM